MKKLILIFIFVVLAFINIDAQEGKGFGQKKILNKDKTVTGEWTFPSIFTVDGQAQAQDLVRFINDSDGAVGDSSFVINKLGYAGFGRDASTAYAVTTGGKINGGSYLIGTVDLVDGLVANTLRWARHSSLDYHWFYADNELAFKLNKNDASSIGIIQVDGNKTANNLAEFINDDDGAVGDSSFVITKYGGQQYSGVVVTDAASYSILAANSGKIHLIGNNGQATSLILPAEAIGLNYEFWYVGGAAEADDDTLNSENDTNYFIGGVSFLDAGDAIASVYSDGDSHSKLILVNMAGGTKFNVVCDGVNWYLTGAIVSDTTPAFADQ